LGVLLQLKQIKYLIIVMLVLSEFEVAAVVLMPVEVGVYYDRSWSWDPCIHPMEGIYWLLNYWVLKNS